MRCICHFLWMLGLSFPVLSAQTQQRLITAVDYTNHAGHSLEFVVSPDTHYRVFTLSNPSRLVVDFTGMGIQALNLPPANHPLIASARSGVRNLKDLRVVFELKADVDIKTQVVKQAKNDQLLIELLIKAGQQTRLEKIPLATATGVLGKVLESPALAKPVSMKTVKLKGRDIVVAIDAGHGGKDVGAQGGNGTQEKDVVFAIAKRLEGMVNKQPGMKAVMTRKGDYFVHLGQRVRMAHEAKADLFVSIHADAFNDPSARGASVYTLAKKGGASSQGARWLAESENAADAFGLRGLEYRDDTLSSVLHDLTQNAAKEASQNIGNKVLRNVKSVGHLHRTAVQKAGFVVLKSPDIPSILVETAFISNPDEERRLNSSIYQDKMASAVFGGIMAHFRQYAPANTLLAQLSRSGKNVMPLAVGPVVDSKPLVLSKAENSERVIK